MLKLVGALVIVLASFFATLGILRYWTESETVRNLLREPHYDAATLPHLKPTESLLFSNGQNRSALLSGWSSGEPSGVWSDGHAAFMGFVVDAGAGAGVPKTIVLRANLFANATKRQRVQVWSGGKRLAEYDLKASSAELAVPLDGVNVGNGTPVLLAFYLPDAAAPSRTGSGEDRRDLALFIISLSLAP
jgi:hypothetical protein